MTDILCPILCPYVCYSSVAISEKLTGLIEAHEKQAGHICYILALPEC